MPYCLLAYNKTWTYKYIGVLNAKYFSHGAFRRKYVFDMYGEYEAAEKRSMAETATKRQGKKEEIKRAEISWLEFCSFILFFLRLFAFLQAQKTDPFASGGKLAFAVRFLRPF